jgi:hypothetical protein
MRARNKANKQTRKHINKMALGRVNKTASQQADKWRAHGHAIMAGTVRVDGAQPIREMMRS